MRSLFFSILFFVLIIPGAALAQSLDMGMGVEAFTASVSPQYPTPNSIATISFVSSMLDLSNATIAVSVNGDEIYRGSVRPTRVSVGNAGSVTNIQVTLTAAGIPYTQTIAIQPQDVALVIEPISSAPILYNGKALVPLEGSARIVAVANVRNARGKAIDPAALSYSWTVDSTHIANSSGIGKESIIVASPLQYRSRSVSVAVTSQDGLLVGGASLSFAANEPIVRVYKNDPLLGIVFSHAISNTYTINGSEDTLFAVPFSFSTTGGAPLLQWFLNGAPAQTGASITLRPSGSGQGTASLSVVASSGDSTTATKVLSLSFGSTGGFNLFGL